MDENRKALAAKLEEEKRKKAAQKPQESTWNKLAKSGWLGTKRQVEIEAEEQRKGK
jgi:hypothetical protein